MIIFIVNQCHVQKVKHLLTNIQPIKQHQNQKKVRKINHNKTSKLKKLKKKVINLILDN